MIEQMPTQFRNHCRLVVVLALLAGASACGQIGPLYLPDQNDSNIEHNEPQAEDEKDDSENPGGL